MAFRYQDIGSSLSVHLHVPVLPLGRCLDPQDVVAPDQDLTQVAGELLVEEFLRVRQLDVHIGVNGDEAALVFGLAPL
jgi:hypothetical protein